MQTILITSNPTCARGAEYLKICLKEDGIDLDIHYLQGGSSSKKNKKTRRTLKSVWRKFKILKFLNILFVKYRQQRLVRVLFQGKPYEACFLYTDISGYSIENVVVKYCKKNNIPTFICPFAFYSRPKNLLATRKMPAFTYSSPLKGQIFESSGKCYHFFPRYMEYALFLSRFLPKTPWHFGTGDADYLLVKSLEDLEYFKNNSKNKKEVILIKSIFFQYLDGIKQSANEEILLVLPQYVEHDLLEEDIFWSKMIPLLEFLDRNKRSIRVSLHPKMAASYYQDKLSSFKNCFISENRLIDDIKGSAYVISSYSSTLDWGVYLGKPVVLFDFWGLNLEMKGHYSSIALAKDMQKFREAIQSIEKGEFLDCAQREMNSIRESLGPNVAAVLRRLVGKRQDESA